MNRVSEEGIKQNLHYWPASLWGGWGEDGGWGAGGPTVPNPLWSCVVVGALPGVRPFVLAWQAVLMKSELMAD